jgi:integrase
MASTKISFPKYRLHRGSGQAFVQVKGKRHYLGVHNTPESKEAYSRFIAELANNPTVAAPLPAADESLTIVELVAAHWDHAQAYYVKDGRQTNQLGKIHAAMKRVKELYGSCTVEAFTPKSLKAVRRTILDSGASRKYINDLVQIIKNMFRWGVSEELVPETVYRALLTVDGLRQGRTAAREPEPVGPVDDTVVNATLPYLPIVVAALTQFQRYTGCRPGEACRLRPMDLDRSGEIWESRPASHKTQHHGKSRVVFIGPQAQAVILPYLDRPADAYCFDPRESVQRKIEAQRERRKTRVQPSQKDRRKRHPKRKPTPFYRTNAYLWAIKRAVEKGNKQILEEAKEMGIDNPDLIPAWHPNQLRHTAATTIRKQFGLEAAQVILGHSKADVTQIYAERDKEKGIAIAKQIG